MPNWCNNHVVLEHDDPLMIARAMNAFTRGELLQEFIPCPAELLDSKSSQYGGPQAAEFDALREANKVKFGFANWYDWRLANWGTKWDVGGNNCTCYDVDNTLHLEFDSAWAPPTSAYPALEELGFRVRAFFFEPGMDFAGLYEEGNEYSMTVEDALNADFGQELDEIFQIRAQQETFDAECEAEQGNQAE